MNRIPALFFGFVMLSFSSGCYFNDHLRRDVDGLINLRAGDHVNGLDILEQDGARYLRSYGRISGQHQPSELTDFSVASRMEKPGLKFLVHASDSQISAVQGLLFAGEDEVDFSEPTINNLLKYVRSLPLLRQHDIVVHVVMTPQGSGVSVLLESPVSNQIEIVLVHPFDVDTQLPSGYWWPKLATLALHELFHVNFALDPGAKSLSRENEEAAATLIAACLSSDIAVETNSQYAFRLDILNEARLREFPGITEGRFSPSISALDELAHPSLRGKNIAAAIIFLELGMEEYVLFRESEALDTLKQACLDFGTRVPDFMSGERPWIDDTQA